MILMLSGEGKTDMGQMVPTERGMRFEPGPMAWLVDRMIGHDASAAEQAEWVRTGKIDPERIDMPSFNAFRDELNDILDFVAAG